MKIAVVSDIHGNFEACCAVFEDILPRKVDRIISLGDNIGYGPDGEKVTQMVMQLGISSVVGNHELSMFDKDAFAGLNFQAQENNRRVKEMLSFASLSYCERMPLFIQFEGLYFVHGFPPNLVNGYLSEMSNQKLTGYFGATKNYICFVGHTHQLSLISWTGDQVEKTQLGQGVVTLGENKKYIINAGSVGQPRDKDKRAKYVVWDTETFELEVVYVSYDSVPTRNKIRELGFPEVYASRLK